jgi:3-phytase
MSDHRWTTLALAGAALVAATVVPARAVVVSPRVTLRAPAADDQDDFCIWIHPADPSLSTVIASDKAAERLFVYDLAGDVLQTEAVNGECGNIDVRYGFPLAGELLDIAVFNNRTTGRLQVYRIDASSRVLTRIDEDDLPPSPDNYGLCLYRSPTTGAFHAFTTTKSGVIRQFELYDSGSGVAATQVRSWSYGSITEGCVADDDTGHAHFADEQHGIWKVGAEPGDPTPGTMVAHVGDPIGLHADVEGLALYYAADGGGYLFASSQGNGVAEPLAGRHGVPLLPAPRRPRVAAYRRHGGTTGGRRRVLRPAGHRCGPGDGARRPAPLARARFARALLPAREVHADELLQAFHLLPEVRADAPPLVFVHAGKRVLARPSEEDALEPDALRAVDDPVRADRAQDDGRLPAEPRHRPG